MSYDNWQVKKTKTIHTNRLFKVIRKDVIRPDGTVGDYYILRKNVDFFSIVIPITASNSTYLVGQYRIAPQHYSWEFPMGGVVGKNDPLTVAKQELKEETGLVANQWSKLGWFHLASGHTNQKAYVFVARDLVKHTPEPDEGEFLTVREVLIEQIGEMIKQGRIVDGPTIASYQWYILTQN